MGYENFKKEHSIDHDSIKIVSPWTDYYLRGLNGNDILIVIQNAISIPLDQQQTLHSLFAPFCKEKHFDMNFYLNGRNKEPEIEYEIISRFELLDI